VGGSARAQQAPSERARRGSGDPERERAASGRAGERRRCAGERPAGAGASRLGLRELVAGWSGVGGRGRRERARLGTGGAQAVGDARGVARHDELPPPMQRSKREQHAGDATGCGDPAGGYAGVPAVFQRHTRVSRGGLNREQENPEVREGVSIANQSGPIGFSHKFTTSSSSYPSPIVRARPQHLKKAREPSYRASSDPFAETSSPWQSRLSSLQITVRNTPPAILRPLQSPGELRRHPRNLITVEHFSSPILFVMGIHFSPVLLYNQSYPKVCPDSLNLPNAGDSFAGTSSLSSYSLFSPTRDLIASI
jgi:hypothetical protein